jgi:CelD/BcsL family acetyltransferase involved in cellulose biosynthesis
MQVSLEIRVLRTLEEVEHIRNVWSAMQWCPESDIDFYSFIVKVRPEIVRPHVLVVYRHGQPVAIFAGRVENSLLEIKIGYKVIWRAKVRRIINPYGGFMGESSREVSEALIRQLLRSLREESADILLLASIRRDAELARLTRRVPNPLCRDYLPHTARHWTMNLPASLEEILEQRMSKKHRYWARRIMRLLEKDFPGALRYACYSAPNEVEKLYKDAHQVARKTYQWGLGVGFCDSEEQRKRLRLEAEKGWLRGYVLYLRDEPVAFWNCVVYQDKAYLASTGYDPAFAKYEVGTALFLRLINDMCCQNLKQLDFGIGSAFYKERFGDIGVEEDTICVFASTFRGIFLNALRLLTSGSVGLVRGTVRLLGLEQRLKRAWRKRIASTQAAPLEAKT